MNHTCINTACTGDGSTPPPCPACAANFAATGDRYREPESPKVPALAKQWTNGIDEAVRRLHEMLEDATGRFDMDARSRAALAFVLSERKDLVEHLRNLAGVARKEAALHSNHSRAIYCEGQCQAWEFAANLIEERDE